MTYLLDTNTCIGWLRQNQPQIVARIQAQAQTDIMLCSVAGRAMVPPIEIQPLGVPGQTASIPLAQVKIVN